MKQLQLSVRTKAAISIGILIFIFATAFSQAVVIPFDTTRWDLSGAKQTEFLGRSCLTGTAFLRNFEVENGIIELDMAVTGQRSYPGVLFHATSPDDYERIYLRPHLPPTFQNVIQYVSAFNGIDSWQLYSGQGNTASAEIPKNEWFHVKIEFRGNQARFFLNNSETPDLAVSRLEHGARSGMVGVSGPGDGSAYFSHFSVTKDENLLFPAGQTMEIPYGTVTGWELSKVFKLTEVDNEMTPEAQGLTSMGWRPVTCRFDGIVDVSQTHGRLGSSPDIIFARTTLESPSDQVKVYSFGYSDLISVFLNGQLLFSGNSAYTSRDPSFQGIVGLNDYITLPLKKGKNELLITVAESFGGWGFAFRDARAIFLDGQLKPAWEVKNKLKYPECVVYDSKRDLLYVSNYYNDGREFISKISPDGTVISTEWVTGVMQPSGLCMSGDKLYVVGRFALVEIDPEQGLITNRYRFPNPGMPNDVTADDAGNLYITDSQRNLIYRFSAGTMEVWLESPEIRRPNGILFDRGKILAGTSGDGCIKVIDPHSRAISTLVCIGEGSIMDGIAADGKGNYLISDYNGRVFRISPAGEKRLLLDATSPSRFCAAFEYIPAKKLLIIPSLTDNRLSAYTITGD